MFAVIRVRGSTKTDREVIDTLSMLRLNSVNHCVLVSESPQYIGMLRKVQGWVTWGDIDQATLVKMIEKRGKLVGGSPISAGALKELGYDSFAKLADVLIKGKVKPSDLERMKPVFRLSPPIKGWKQTRLPYPRGALGYRKKDINELIERMI